MPAVVLSPDGVPLDEGVGTVLAQHIEAAIAARPMAALMRRNAPSSSNFSTSTVAE